MNWKNILYISSKKLCGVGSEVKRFISFESNMLFIRGESVVAVYRYRDMFTEIL